MPLFQAIAKDMKMHYHNTGSWILHFDFWNISSAWTKLTSLYEAKLLFGVTKLFKANKPHPKKYQTGIPIILNAGPCTDKEHCIKVGENIVRLLNYKRQQCNKNYAGQIYYKMSKKPFLFEKGPRFYAVKYE